MQVLIHFSRLVDTINHRIGTSAGWLILVMVMVSVGNALARYLFDSGSNAWLELQWYLFSAVFLLGGGYALLHNAHVRIDILFMCFSRRNQLLIELFGTTFFLLPLALLMLYLSWPIFMNALISQEKSANAGGLLIWPARLLVPLGFLLLTLQALSEFIKRLAILRGLLPDPATAVTPLSAEQELADTIRQSHQATPGVQP